MNKLTGRDFTEAGEPFDLFDSWLTEARRSEVNDPEAMALATVDANGLPDVRMVLLKEAKPKGFVFYSNAESAKGRQLEAQPKAAALFHWKSLRRQARFRGAVTPLDDAEADAYFHSRARQSQIGAWASQQSRPLESRATLVMKAAEYAARFGFGEVPRPAYWRGYQLNPVEVELWSDGAFRLHDRVRFTRTEGGWTKRRLNP